MVAQENYAFELVVWGDGIEKVDFDLRVLLLSTHLSFFFVFLFGFVTLSFPPFTSSSFFLIFVLYFFFLSAFSLCGNFFFLFHFSTRHAMHVILIKYLIYLFITNY
jgi:hypothetical protein